jgi:hypothetical protein
MGTKPPPTFLTALLRLADFAPSHTRGDNREGWDGPRYGAYHDLTAWQALLTAAGFVELEHYYRPAGLPREQQPWLASVWRKT